MTYQKKSAIGLTKLASLISIVTIYGFAGCGGAGDALPGATNVTVKHDASAKRDTSSATGGAAGGTFAAGTGGSGGNTDVVLGTGGATTSIPDASIPRDTTPDLAADSARPPLDLGVGAETPVPLDMGVEVSRDATPLDLPMPDAPIDVPPDAPADRAADVSAPDAAEAGDHPDNDLPSDLPSDRAAILPDTADRPTADTAEAPAGPACSNPSWAQLLAVRTQGWMSGDKEGNLFMASSLLNSVEFGGTIGTLSVAGGAAGTYDALIVRLDPATGNPVWAKQFGDVQEQTAIGVAIDKSGHLGFVGTYNGSMTIGPESALTSHISNLGTWPYGYVGGIQAADGAGLWAISTNLRADDGSSGMLTAIAANPNFDDFVVCGKANIAATELVAEGVAGGGYDIVVAKIKGSDGTIIAARQIGGTGDQSCTAAAINDSGDVIIAGTFNGQLDFGSGALSPVPEARSSVPWIAKLSGTDLSTIAAVSASPAATSRTTGYVYGLDTDSAGNVAIAGTFTNALTLGSTTLTSVGLQDAFAVKLGPSLAPIWAKRWGDAKTQNAYSIAFDSSGNLTAVGSFLGTINIGTGGALLTASSDATGSNTDVFIARLSGASGDPECALGYGDPAAQAAYNVVVPRSATGATKDAVFASGQLMGNSVLNFTSVAVDATNLSDPTYFWVAKF